MAHPILVTGAAGGAQGTTGCLITRLLLEPGIPVRAVVHKLDSRSDELRQQGAEVVERDLLDSASVQAGLRNVKRAYSTYLVAEGLLEAATIFTAARDAARELVMNNSQFQGRPGDLAFRDLWQTFRKGEERYQSTDAIRMVTGRNPQKLEEFFRENAGFFAAGTQEA